MKIPYGIADFRELITGGYLYVDRTAYVGKLEALGKALLFLRPRRFGKSLWLRTLACYYDLRTREEHDRLFGRLAAGREPTPLAHRYFVLTWNFSEVEPLGTQESLAERLNDYVNSTIRVFARDYRHHLPEEIAIRPHATDTLRELLAVLRETPYRLYLLIDEYDNFANEVMMADEAAYRGLVSADGPFKNLLKSVKSAMEGQGLERLFLTGVSPIVMSDLTSGLNISESVHLYPELEALCGFTEAETGELLEHLHDEHRAAGEAGWSVAEALEMVRTWYDGYRFSPDAGEPIYNPTLVLYFLKHLGRTGSYPDQMLDVNLALDEGKLTYLAREVPGQQAVMDIVQSGEPLEIRELVESFPLAELLDREAHDLTFVGSFLYYFGMLTLVSRTALRTHLLAPPNLVTRKLYLEHIRRFLVPDPAERSAAGQPALALLREGDAAPLASYVEEKVFRRFSNLDYRWMNELAVKTAFLSLLFNDASYTISSEAELGRGRADLCLLRRPDARTDAAWDLLLEFKYVQLGSLGFAANDLRRMNPEDLAALKPVKDAFASAEDQLERYRDALLERHGTELRLRSIAVVALGFERLLTRELD